jgi:hypothetical protein
VAQYFLRDERKQLSTETIFSKLPFREAWKNKDILKQKNSKTFLVAD